MAAPASRTSVTAKAPPARGSAPAPGRAAVRPRGPMAAPPAAPAGPLVKLGTNPAAKDTRFQKVMDKLQASAARTKRHQPATEKAHEAQAAAQPPANEKLAGAQAQQIDQMKAADTKKPEPDSFLTMLRAEIQKVMPKKVEDTENYMKGDDRQQLKGAMTGNINQQKDQATAGIKGASNQAPDPTRIQGKEVTPLPAETPPPTPPAVGAADAMPAPKPEAEVSLQQGKQEADQKLADAQVTPKQLQKANDPRFSAVVDARGEVYKQADAGPKQYRADEQKVLSQAAAQAVNKEHQDLGGMRGAKGRGAAGVRKHQVTAKERDEARRKEVTDHIEGIYARTKESVDKKLAGLETEVGTMFDEGADGAIAKMKAYVEERFDDRYSGISGGVLWLKDKFLPLPDSVKAWFDEAHAVFVDELDKLVVRVAAHVEQRLKEAKDEIANAQKEIKDYVDKLDPDLKDVGRQAEKKVAEQFNELRQAVDDKKNDLAQSLAQHYKDAYDKGEAALKELKDAHKSLIEKLVDKLKEIVEILRNFKNRIMSMLSQARDAIDLIVSDPIGFLSNLLSAIKQGLSQFVANIWIHIKAGFMKWLFGSLADAGITIPADFSLGSILKLVLQVLGLTYDRIRAKAVRLIGERNVTLLEKAWALIHTLITGGPAALWDQIKEFVGDLQSTLLDAIQDWVVTSVIKAAITKLATMFNPVGAIIQAIITIYNTVMFFIENINRILDFVQAIISSVYKIATGDIASAANWIEQALADTIPIIIGFLARLLGLSGVTDKIVGFIKKIQSTVDKAIDKLIEKVVGGIRKLLGAGADGKATESEMPTVQVQEGVSLTGEAHTVSASTQTGEIQISMASALSRRLQPALEGAITEVDKDNSRFKAEKPSILSILKDAKAVSDEKAIRKEWDTIGSGLRRTLPEREQVRVRFQQFLDTRLKPIVSRLQGLSKYKIHSLEDLFKKVPKQRKLPDGYDVRGRLYERGSGWASVRDSVYSVEKAKILAKVDAILALANKNVGKQRLQELYESDQITKRVLEKYDDGTLTVRYVRDIDYQVDHRTPLARHWITEGLRSDDAARWSRTVNRGNLRLITKEANLSKGGEGYHFSDAFWVEPTFVSIYAEGGIANARTIDGKPFRDENNQPLA